ncbi:MAG TPA: hypothetical protein P5267_01230 [Patescibacteria group bacterium]|nr:hypothetical protein [Patescibacteria group bacterium]
MSVLLLFFFWLTLCLFGWQFTKIILREQRLEFSVPLAPAVGVTFYLFSLNILGYFLPLDRLFSVVCIFYGLVGIILLLFAPKTANKQSATAKSGSYLKIFFIFLIISVFVLVIGLRSLGGDEIAIGSLPTIATISEGNFPIVRLEGPPSPTIYHYAPLVLTAAIHKITAIPIWYVTDINRAIFSLIFSLLVFTLLLTITQDNKKSAYISLITLLASGLAFFNIFKIIPIALDRLTHHAPVSFKFITDSFGSFFSPLLKIFNIEWSALAFVLFFSSVLIYFRLLYKDKINPQERLAVFITLVIFVSLLGLTAEMYLAVLLFSFLIYPLLARFIGGSGGAVTKNFLISCALIITSAIIVRYQGGVFTSYSSGAMGTSWSPSFFTDFLRYAWSGRGNFYPWSFFFIYHFGFLLILIIPSLYWLVKRRFLVWNQEISFFALSSLVAFIVPFCVALIPAHNHEMARFFYLASALWGLLVALAIFDFVQCHPKTYVRIAGYTILASLVASGFIYLGAYIIIPAGRTADHLKPFFQYYPKPTALENGVYAWVREHTTTKDYFLTYSDLQISGTPNAKFIVYTGRLASRYQFVEDLYADIDPLLIETFKSVEKDCDLAAVRALNYHYLYINQYWPTGLAEKCLEQLPLKLEYAAATGSEYAQIYRLVD